MNTQEFIVIPKCFYTQQNNSTLQVLKDPEVEQKGKSLTLLKRNKTFTETSPVDENEKIANENLLRSRYPDSGPETKKNIFQAKLKLPPLLILLRLVSQLWTRIQQKFHFQHISTTYSNQPKT